MIKIIGCDFHPGDQADCNVGQGDRRDVGEGAESRKEGGGAGLLRGIAGARARGAGSKRAVAVVRAAAGRIRTRRKTFFARIWADTGRTGCPAVVATSREAGADAQSGEEPVAGAGVEPGRAAEVEIAECEGTAAIGKLAVAAVGSVGRWRKWPWRGSWQCVCTGCCARKWTTRSCSRVPMQDRSSHSVVVVETVLLSGHRASPKSWGVRRSNHGRSR